MRRGDGGKERRGVEREGDGEGEKGKTDGVRRKERRGGGGGGGRREE